MIFIKYPVFTVSTKKFIFAPKITRRICTLIRRNNLT